MSSNQAMQNMPDYISTDDIATCSRRQLAVIAQVNGVGTPQWRNTTATKNELLQALLDQFPGGRIPTKKKLSIAFKAPQVTSNQESSTMTTQKTSNHLNGLIKPAIDSVFVISEAQRMALSYAVAKNEATGFPPNIEMVGPKGCGKTELAMQFAARQNMPLLKMNCPTVRETREWFGYRGVRDGETYWHVPMFVRAVRGEFGPVVILLDEITRSTPIVLNALLPLLDGTRQTYIEEIGEVITVAKNVFFLATANIGAEYTGTHGQLDSALDDRFGIKIECSYLSQYAEQRVLQQRTGIDQDSASRLVKVATAIREQSSGMGNKLTETVSTRLLTEIAAMYMHVDDDGEKIGVKAFDVTLYPRFDNSDGVSSERSQVQQIVQGQFRR